MAKLDIHQINNLSSFKDVKERWEQLYKSDPNSQVYISWLWLYGLFSTSSFKWVVLAVKNVGTASYVAFLPMTLNNHRIYPIREITNVGKPIAAYSGFLCSPDFESEAIQILASYIQSRLRWDILLIDWTKDPRFDNFLSSFPDSKFLIKVSKGLPSLCITLPDDYQTYLSQYLSEKRRQNIRVKTKFIQESEKYRITYSTANTIERDIDITCKQWFNRWHKERETEWHRKVMFEHFENDLLRLSIIWDGEKAVSTLACIIDPENKIYNAYITSYNRDYSKISPGIVIFAESIKQAIELNYKYYDFTLGLDPYKLSFGPEQYETKNITINRKRLKTRFTLFIIRQVRSVLNKLR